MLHPHLEALHSLRGVPYEEALGPRINKENMLVEYGFTKGSNPAEFVAFNYAENKPENIQTYLYQKLGEGKYSALLFKDGTWESMGGCPVVYIMCKTDLDEKLTFDEAGGVKQLVIGGEVYAPSKNTKLNIYTRTCSVGATLVGFENYDVPLRVSLGGGFRLQVDGIVYESSMPYLTISAYFSFNDYGSRVLSKGSEDDARVPMACKSFRIPIVDGSLEFTKNNIELSDVVSVNDAMDLVLNELFSNDRKAIINLTRDLLTIRPAMQIHQLEGIYGVTDKNGVSAEVIDFDGLDTFDITDTEARSGERLAGGQLVLSGYVKDTDQGARVAYYQNQEKMRELLSRLAAVEEVSDDVKALATMHPSEDIASYVNRLGMYGRLARSIGYFGLKWVATSAPNVAQSNVNEWTVTKVEAGGFEAVFIESRGRVVKVKDPREIYDLTKRVLGSSMLRLHVSLSREGD